MLRLFRDLCSLIRGTYWGLVRTVNPIAHFRHGVERDPEDWDSIEVLRRLETNAVMRRADRAHISLSEIPLPDGCDTHWDKDDGGGCLHHASLCRLQKLVEDREHELRRRKREGRELWIKWFTAVAAAVGGLGGAATLWNVFGRK